MFSRCFRFMIFLLFRVVWIGMSEEEKIDLYILDFDLVPKNGDVVEKLFANNFNRIFWEKAKPIKGINEKWQ